jgi:hypothetical protein
MGRELKSDYPRLQIEIYDAANTARTLLSELDYRVARQRMVRRDSNQEARICSRIGRYGTAEA